MTPRVPRRLAGLALLVCLGMTLGCLPKAPQAKAQPYDESADAAVDVAAAMAEANASGKQVLLVFGANWCPDCRLLATAMADPEVHGIIDKRFAVVHVDVGRWDRNTELVQTWGNPIAKGIPSVVVATAAGKVLQATTQGEVSRARRMGEEEFEEFFRLLAALE